MEQTEKNEKTLDQRITELDMTIRYLIGEAKLSPTIVELIIKNIHQEIAALAKINLEQQAEKQKAEEKQESEDGDNTGV